MDEDVKVLERIYDRFNARDIDGVLTVLTDDVTWANGHRSICRPVGSACAQPV